MRKLIIAGMLVTALGGCTTLPTSVDISTSASRNTLYGVVNGYGAALAAENTYKNLCIQGLADKNCRSTVVKMQTADKKAVAAIVSANSFMKQYPTVSAANVIQAATEAVNDFKVITGAQ